MYCHICSATATSKMPTCLMPYAIFILLYAFLLSVFLYLIWSILPSDIKLVNNYTNSGNRIRNNRSSPRVCWLVSTWNPRAAAGHPPKSKRYPSSYIHNNIIQHHFLVYSQFLIIYMLLTFWITSETMCGFLATPIWMLEVENRVFRWKRYPKNNGIHFWVWYFHFLSIGSLSHWI